jgi:hypothetical protein
VGGTGVGGLHKFAREKTTTIIASNLTTTTILFTLVLVVLVWDSVLAMVLVAPD